MRLTVGYAAAVALLLAWLYAHPSAPRVGPAAAPAAAALAIPLTTAVDGPPVVLRDPYLEHPRRVRVIDNLKDRVHLLDTVTLALPAGTFAGRVINVTKRDTMTTLRVESLEGEGRALLVYNAGLLTGSIETSAISAEIRPLGESQAYVADVNLQQPVTCAVVGQGRGEGALCGGTPSGDARIDVLALYTRDVQTESCPECSVQQQEQAMIGFIKLCEEKTTDAFLSSGIPVAVRVTPKLYADYRETGVSETDLNNLEQAVAAPDVGQWRADAAADLVTLIVKESDKGGRAILLTDPVADFKPRALSVVWMKSALPAYSFPHELAHNLGAGHEIDDGDPDGYCGYSHGWHFLDIYEKLRFRTVMSEASGYKRVRRFSGPDARYGSVPTGVLKATDNVRTIHLAAPEVAKFLP